MAEALSVKLEFDTAGLAARAEAAAQAAVQAAGADVLARAAAMAPRRTGALAASAALTVEGSTARVSFGAPYAPIQHDGTGFRHPGGGQARFLAAALEDPATLAAMAEAFGAAMR